MKKEQNYDFDYVVPLEVLHKQYVKSNKEYNERLKAKKEQEDFNKGIEISIMLFVMVLSVMLSFLSFFTK